MSTNTIKLARTAGFCMGVRRAVDLALDLARSRRARKIYTYGPLIHSPQTIEILKKRGIEPLKDIKDVKGGEATIIIRAHGISPKERSLLEAAGCEIVDGTCPKVSHVQSIINKHHLLGYRILIIGDPDHPEVLGLLGYTENKGIVLSSEEEVELLPPSDKLCVVAQTTQDVNNYGKIVERLRKRFPDATVFNTICLSTEMRQQEIGSLAAETEAIVVVGGKNSANSKRLAEIAQSCGKPTFHIETAAELSTSTIAQYRSIGLSAGASTPNWIIDEVIDKIWINKRRAKVGKIISFWMFTIKADIFAALGAASLTYCGLVVSKLEIDLLPLLVASLYVFAAHTINRYISLKSASLTHSFRAGLVLEHERVFISTALLALFAALALSLLRGAGAFLLLLVLSFFGTFYYIDLLPRHWPFRSIKDIPGSKNVAIALAWALVTILLPKVAQGFVLTPDLVITFIFTFLIVFIRSALSDILNMQSDRLLGQETLPVLLGKKQTKRLIFILTVCLFLIIVASVSVNWLSNRGIFLLLCLFYIWICLKLCDRRTALSGVVLEGMLEVNYLLAGVAALVGYIYFG